jgi:hypothetical protein
MATTLTDAYRRAAESDDHFDAKVSLAISGSKQRRAVGGNRSVFGWAGRTLAGDDQHEGA